MTYNRTYYLKNRSRILEKYHQRKREERTLSKDGDPNSMKPDTIVIERKKVLVMFD